MKCEEYLLNELKQKFKNIDEVILRRTIYLCQNINQIDFALENFHGYPCMWDSNLLKWEKLSYPYLECPF